DLSVITRIEIGYKPGVRDPEGEAVAGMIAGYMDLPVDEVKTIRVYKISAELAQGDLDPVIEGLRDPVLHDTAIGKLDRNGYDWTITVGYSPGVTDNVGTTARLTLEDMLGRSLGPTAKVFTETRYLFHAPELTRAQAERMATGCLANPLIETIRVQTRAEFEESPPDLTLPIMTGCIEPAAPVVDLDGDDDFLLHVSRVKVLSLNLREMQAIRAYFKEKAGERKAVGLGSSPTDAELEVLAQTWSEHCKHKIFNAIIKYQAPGQKEATIRSLFKTYIQGSTQEIAERLDLLVSVFHDNAGVIRFNDELNLVYKVETHNSPSALDPYGGAITGIVGVNRDPFGTGRGAMLLTNVWGYCLASPFYSDPVPTGLLHPRRIRDGVHQGVIDGGNQSGIPYSRGFEWYDQRYLGKPLVYCGTLGLMPKMLPNGELAHVKVVKPGDLIVMVGGRIGKDGIHGATFSSQELHDESPVQAVQIGDPITQKKMTDFLLEARDRLLYTSITDNGAGGLSSSVGEMAQLSGGCDMDLEKAPLKYEGLAPWEILLSEAQERMTLAVPPDCLDALLDLAEARDVEVTVLGTFTESGKFHVRYGDREVTYLDMEFMHEGCPTLELEAVWEPPTGATPAEMPSGDLTGQLVSVLSRLNISSKEEKSRQYDHEVKGLSVIKPFVGKENDIPSDATVMRVDYQSLEGVVLAEGINPRFSDVDTYWMAASVVDLTLRRIVAAGGELGTIAGLDNFCWPDPEQSGKTPDGRYKLAQLVRACQGLSDLTRAYDLPLISGKDSMKNDTHMGNTKISIPPTLLFSGVGKISDISRSMTPDAKFAGDAVYVLGKTDDELAGSEFFAWLGEKDQGAPYLGGQIPRVHAVEALALYRVISRAIHAELVHSVHTPSLGGLGVGFAMKAMGGELGMEIDLNAIPRGDAVRDDATALFSETNSRFIVTVNPSRVGEFESLLKGVDFARVGSVTPDGRLHISGLSHKTIIDAQVMDLKRKWQGVLREI
ncbi:MAG: phosphoribosylformylglycinamidine synthase subunit PurS, partial [Planctomycetota bacterium]